jgi:hypothetical protein
VTGLDVELRRAKPRAAFRVYYDRHKRGAYCQVVILKDAMQVRKFAALVSGVKRVAGDIAGFTKEHHTLVRGNDGRLRRNTKCVGWVFTADTHVGSGYVAHELTHAAQFRLVDQGLMDKTFGDRSTCEPLAEMVEWLTTQFWLEYYSRFHGEEK